MGGWVWFISVHCTGPFHSESVKLVNFHRVFLRLRSFLSCKELSKPILATKIIDFGPVFFDWQLFKVR